ncbi:MAG: hypothetical protein AB7D09_12775 [Methanosarcina sp.]
MPNKLKDFDNFQLARQKCFRSFVKCYQGKKDAEEALQKALDTAKINNQTLELTNNYYKGLKGEIIFFGKCYKTLNLDPLVEIGDVHADFHSQVTKQYYDVTTNLDYKDINDYIRNDSKECMIAYVDIKKEEIDLIPTVFEHCPICGNSLHYIYSLNNDVISESLIGIDYPSQVLNKCCSNCDYIKDVGESFYFIYSHHNSLDNIFEDSDENDPEVKKYLQDEYGDIADLGRKHFDYFISAVTRPEDELGKNKHDLYKVDKTKWIHPILDLSKNPSRNVYFDKDIINYYD